MGRNFDKHSKPSKNSFSGSYEEERSKTDQIVKSLSIANLHPSRRGIPEKLLAIEKSEGWKVFSNIPEKKASFSAKYDSETHLYYCKGVIKLEISPEEAVILFTEPNYAKMINPLVKEVELLDGSEESEFAIEREMKMVLRGYWPVVQDREMVFRTLSVINGDHSVAMNINFHEPELDKKHAAVAKNRVRAVLHIGGIIVRRCSTSIASGKDDAEKMGGSSRESQGLASVDGREQQPEKPNSEASEEKRDERRRVKSEERRKESRREEESEVVYIVKADPKGWVIPKMALQLLNSSQAKLILNLERILQAEIYKYKFGREVDPLIFRMLKMRELDLVHRLDEEERRRLEKDEREGAGAMRADF